MSDDTNLQKVFSDALSGRGAHADTAESLEGLTLEQAGAFVPGSPHTIFQTVNHLIYWHDFALAWLDGEKPATPEHAELSWPGDAAPNDEEEWQGAVTRFREGLAAFHDRAARGDLFEQVGEKNAAEILQLIASHNSYHIGQIALLRRIQAAWPPPAGGATW